MPRYTPPKLRSPVSRRSPTHPCLAPSSRSQSIFEELGWRYTFNGIKMAGVFVPQASKGVLRKEPAHLIVASIEGVISTLGLRRAGSGWEPQGRTARVSGQHTHSSELGVSVWLLGQWCRHVRRWALNLNDCYAVVCSHAYYTHTMTVGGHASSNAPLARASDLCVYILV